MKISFIVYKRMRYCLIIILVVLIVWNIKLYIEFPEKTITSAIDGEKYVVKKNYEDAAEASNILARLNRINNKLIDHLEKKYVGTQRESDVWFLAKNYNGDVLQEHTPRSGNNTSYVLNKGDIIKLCLRDPKKDGKFHDFNTLLFVNLHELSHLLDREYGHERSFWTGFNFVLKEANSIGLYDPINYDVSPADYCGIRITSNPFYINY